MAHSSQIRSGVFARVNDLHLGERERQRINAYMQDGERLAELCSRALAHVQSAADKVARAARALSARPARR